MKGLQILNYPSAMCLSVTKFG